MRKISFCLTTYNRLDYTVRCIQSVIDNENIDEIICLDDCSNDGSYQKLVEYYAGNPKFKLYRNDTNKDCYFAKHLSICHAHNEYAIICDSDNVIGKDYIDTLLKYVWEEDMMLAASFAKPQFDYRAFSGLTISKENINEYIEQPMFLTALNTMNCFMNVSRYKKVFDADFNPHNCDSLYFNYLWLKNGGKIHITDGLEYWHEVHQLSHYVNNIHCSAGIHDLIVEKIKKLR